MIKNAEMNSSNVIYKDTWLWSHIYIHKKQFNKHTHLNIGMQQHAIDCAAHAFEKFRIE